MLVAGVVHDEVDDHPDVALVRLVEEVVEVLDRADLGEDVGVVGDVVPAVAQRRGEERRHPQAVDAEPLEVVELLGQPLEVAGAVAVGVAERADQHLVEDGRLEPVRGAADVVRERSARVAVGGVLAGRTVRVLVNGASSRSGCGRVRGRGRAGRSCAGPSSSPAPVISSCTTNESSQSRPRAGRSRWTVVSRVACGSRLTTTITVSSPSRSRLRRPGRSRRRCSGW